MRNIVAWPVEWLANIMCGFVRHAGACRIASIYYNSRFAHWAYRWNK